MAKINGSSGGQALGEDEQEDSPFTQPGFIAAAALLALIVVLGVVLAVGGGSGGGSGAQGGAVRPLGPSGGVAGRTDAGGSVCGLAAGSQQVPASAPQATWKLRGGLAAPSASEFGPDTSRLGVPACFAHSPTGALFAVADLIVEINELNEHPPNDQTAVIRQIAAAGPGRDAAEKAADSSARPSSASAGVQIAGFKFVRYEQAAAVIDVAFRVDRPGLAGWAHALVSTRWERGDWKLVASDNGAAYDSVEGMSSLDGYVPWSGV